MSLATDRVRAFLLTPCVGSHTMTNALIAVWTGKSRDGLNTKLDSLSLFCMQRAARPGPSRSGEGGTSIVAKMTAMQAAVHVLESEGVGLAFGIPGAAILPLYGALEASRIRHVLVRLRGARGGGAIPGPVRADRAEQRLSRPDPPGGARLPHGLRSPARLPQHQRPGDRRLRRRPRQGGGGVRLPGDPGLRARPPRRGDRPGAPENPCGDACRPWWR